MIYADESGKLAQSDYTSFCGFVGHGTEWERTSLEWNNLRLAWGVPPLHMRCIMFPERAGCESWQKIKAEWGNAWDEKRNEMLAELGALIRQSCLTCVGCVVDSAYFRSMPDSAFKQHQKDPIFLSFHTLLMESLDKIDPVNKCLSVGLVIDDDEQYAIKCYEVLAALKQQFPRVRERISAMTMGRDNDYPGLQMADIAAYEARSYMVSKLENKDAPPSSLFAAITTMDIHIPKLWTAEYLDKVSQRITEKMQQQS